MPEKITLTKEQFEQFWQTCNSSAPANPFERAALSRAADRANRKGEKPCNDLAS